MNVINLLAAANSLLFGCCWFRVFTRRNNIYKILFCLTNARCTCLVRKTVFRLRSTNSEQCEFWILSVVKGRKRKKKKHSENRNYFIRFGADVVAACATLVSMNGKLICAASIFSDFYFSIDVFLFVKFKNGVDSKIECYKMWIGPNIV